MSVSFTQLDTPSETTFLRERVSRLRSSLEWAGEAISPRVRTQVSESVARLDERLKLGVDFTIIALAGGTGSGKSSLFNAIAGIDFATVGVSRPTTGEVSAATWGGNAEALLDWLGVARERRLECETALNAEQEVPLRGLILLDLPDHDSVEPAHRATADTILPMADLVAFVVDPQKYADHALHSRYLAAVAETGTPTVVILNHIDRLARPDADALMFDIRRLLAEKGVDTVPVLLASARSGAGVDSVRSVFASAVKKRSVAAESIRAELVATGRVLAKALAKGAEPTLPSVDLFVAALSRAAGVEARAEAAEAIASGAGIALPELSRLTPAAVDPIRSDWIRESTSGLPTPWRKVLGGAVATSRGLADAVNAALGAVPWPEPERGKKRLGRVKKARSVADDHRARARDAIYAAIAQDVIEPTETIHQAYRALDELTDLG